MKRTEDYEGRCFSIRHCHIAQVKITPPLRMIVHQGLVVEHATGTAELIAPANDCRSTKN
jgi:hypothetical protein